ncbi:ATP-binding cassette domain-containing protein [Agaribacter marinus]|uniref:ATP-binding cassette domain-containing protein n=1 Tax=Virgibacillus salarius TaxID=447199 RepID=A0A941DTT6_9BACI|nr:ATP-binding cassette domain-containing protein [Virgibacillus salarius]MBR7795367.1 ATP-binding cassette domain-containing protein [Virgibacillus salarius]NAZ08082.1 ATP-binding cassette domain-containing protein [Agaribacter marinus]WBX81140.1 ATP-binding cassette domain-containing protein [Virgibacillus salarius]
MTYVVSTSRLSKNLSGKNILSDVNLHIKKGEIYGLLGLNGAGKTSVMKLLTGLWKPTEGVIELFGERLITGDCKSKKRIGSLIDYPIFYEKLTARENLELHCAYMGYHDHRSIDEALALVGLTVEGAKTVKSYSLGMKQRLGLARAISTRPELLLLDEPINGLDPVGLKNMRNLISALSKEYGMTVFLTSHLLRELELIANTIGVIREGKLIREVAMENIQRDWTEYIELVTKDVVKAVSILSNKLEMCNFKLINESTIRIYDLSLPQPEKIVRTLILNGVDIGEIRRKNQTLEDYFLNLLQGSGDT